MNWYRMLLMQGPIFGERVYDAIGALVVFIVGMALLLKARNKFGWVLAALAAVWAYFTFKDLIFM